MEDLVALAVDDLALLVHHVVVLDDVLADVEVVALDLGLGVLDRLGDQAVLDRDVVLEAEPVHDRGDVRPAEALHQVVFERDVEAGRAGLALAAGAAAQLVVDPARLVPLGADDVQAAQLHDALLVALGQRDELVPEPVGVLGLLGWVDLAAVQLPLGQAGRVAAEQDVDAAAGHVRRDRDRAGTAGLGDQHGLLLVVLGVQHLVRYALALEEL